MRPGLRTPRPITGVLIFGVYLLVWMLVAAVFFHLVSPRTVSLLSTLVPAVAAFGMLWAYVGEPLVYLGLGKPGPRLVIYTVLASLALVVPAMSLESVVLQRFKVPQEVIDLLTEILRAGSPAELAYVILISALTVAICEEVVFRGILQKSLVGLLPGWPAIVITSLVFALLHDPWRLAAAFCLGAFLGVIYWRTGSLALSIVAHFTINTVAILGIYAVEMRGEASMPAWVAEGRSAPVLLVVAALAAFAVLMALLWKEGGARAAGAQPSTAPEPHDI